ncbi:MAG: HAD-IA family hydrolase [Acidobacteria bacterium]|nr:HAD-IA family hydrolase [Acidobacteriota bacterium]
MPRIVQTKAYNGAVPYTQRNFQALFPYNGGVEELRAIIFDLDGTLANTLPLIYDAFNHVLEPHLGRRLPPEEIRSHFGPPEQEIFGRLLTAGAVPGAVERLHRFYRVHADRVRLFDGMREVLDYLQHYGVKIGLFTGKGRAGTLITLKQLGLLDRIQAIVAGDDVVCHKPHPEGVVRLLELLEVGNHQALVVGDAPADVRAGKGAGAYTAAALWGSDRRQALLEAGPDWIFATVGELETFCKARVGNSHPT